MSDTVSTFLAPANKEASKARQKLQAVKRPSAVLACGWKGQVGLSPRVHVLSQPASAAAVPRGGLGAPCRHCWTAPLLLPGHPPEDNPSLLPKASPTFCRCLLFRWHSTARASFGGIRRTVFCMNLFFFFFFWLIFSNCFQLRLFLPLKMAGSFALERSAHVKGALGKQLKCRHCRCLKLGEMKPTKKAEICDFSVYTFFWWLV